MSGLSQLYPIARQAFATAALNWPAASIKIMLMANGYIPDFTNQHLSDIPAGQIVATSGNIAGLASSNGYCTGDTTSFGVISSPTEVGSIILFQDTGTPSTSKLIVYFDTPDLPGMPQVLEGFDYYFYQNVSYGGWFRL